jgi:hypothetical protein
MVCRYYELKQCFDQNLEEIESVASEERKELLMKNGAQIQKLFDLFSKMEQNHVDERQKRVEQQQNDLASLRLHDAEDYTSLKVRTGRTLPAAVFHSAHSVFKCRCDLKATCKSLNNNWRKCAPLTSLILKNLSTTSPF